MIVRWVTFSLRLPEARSLKAKRMVVRSLKERMRSRFNVSVAESDHQDVWDRAELSVVYLAPHNAFADSVQERLDQLVVDDGRCVVTRVHRESL